MSTNPNKPTGSAIFNFLPGTVSAPGIGFMNIGGISGGFFAVSHDLTTRFVTKSIDNPLYTAEFDDSLLDMAWWANPRYNGVKSTCKVINKYTGPQFESGVGSFQVGPGENNPLAQQFSNQGPELTVGNYPDVPTYAGDVTYGLNPVIQNESTAIYIANIIVGGKGEDEQFATIQNHSYIGISKIVIVNISTHTVEVLDRGTENFHEFHRFITNDLPTGASFSMKVLDESVSSKLKQTYFCKMNKGWLLKTFDFQHAGEFSGSKIAKGENHLDTNNSMYFYRDGFIERDRYIKGQLNDDRELLPQTPISGARFRYALINMHAGFGDGKGNLFEQTYMGPSFTSSSIINNKYTRQFHSGGFGLIEDRFTVGNTNSERIANSDLGLASRFIGVNCLDFLQQNNANPNIIEEEKTELHVTFLQGVKDFSISVSGSGVVGAYQYNQSANDERSIGTFEVDQNQSALDIGDHCHSFLPQNHELTFKGSGDGRFMPVGDTFLDEVQNSFLEYTGSTPLTHEESLALAADDRAYEGCVQEGEAPQSYARLQLGINLNKIDLVPIFMQGGALGPVGHLNDNSSSKTNYNKSQSGSMTADNYYGGYVNSAGSSSLDWQLSFLDKDHTIIADVNKDEELFDGIGTKGVAIIPGNSHEKINQNLYIYLKKAGLIDNAPDGLANVIIE